MIYIIMGIFIILGLINIYKGKKVIIRPGINAMDLIALLIVAAIFAIASVFIKASAVQSVPMAASIIFYIFTSRWARGITNDGINVIGTGTMVIREYDFSKIKPVPITSDGDYLQYVIRVNDRASYDIQRYKKNYKEEIAKIFNENKLVFAYK